MTTERELAKQLLERERERIARAIADSEERIEREKAQIETLRESLSELEAALGKIASGADTGGEGR